MDMVIEKNYNLKMKFAIFKYKHKYQVSIKVFFSCIMFYLKIFQ